MMRAELFCAGQGKVTRQWDALNDVVVAKGTIARMADFAVEIDRQAVAAFRADGVILSTPTGSTAYNLAADGPIVMPSVNCMVVTPICPHLLTIRPIVVPGESAITVRVTGVANEIFLTVDGQEAVPMHVGDEVRCCRSAVQREAAAAEAEWAIQCAAVEAEVGRAVSLEQVGDDLVGDQRSDVSDDRHVGELHRRELPAIGFAADDGER